MNLHELVSQLIIDTKGSASSSFLDLARDSSVFAFMPEIVLCLTIIALLLARLTKLDRIISSFSIVLIGSLVALGFVAPSIHLASPDTFGAGDPTAVTRMEIFTGMLVLDKFSIFIRAVLLLFLALFAVFTKLSGRPDHEDGPDIYSLVVGATLGMCLMASANHLLMVFMAVEMASVPSYVLAGMLKGRRIGSEAALKYSVYGAGAAGIMLYGISLVAGLANTVHLPTLAVQLSEQLPGMPFEQQMVLATGGLMIMVGLAFKLSAFPFHFWCPDVFEGATAEVNAFLSVASKAAALALLIRVAVGFGAIVPVGYAPGQRTAELSGPEVAVVQPNSQAGLFNIPAEAEDSQHVEQHATDSAHARSDGAESKETRMQNLAPVRSFLGKLIALLAALTCTFGNLAAYGQTNIKRLLAYSTIAHAGYMMMAVPPMLEMAGIAPAAAQNAISSLAVYIAVYVFMNLGAFVIVAFFRNAMNTEDIADYAGLVRRCPLAVICFSLILFSLVGMPPLSGFIGKFAVFASMADGFQQTSAAGAPAYYLLALLVVGGLNTAISLFYYLRVVKVMTIDAEPDDPPAKVFSDLSLQGLYIWVVSAPTVLLIVKWDWLHSWAIEATKHLLV